MPQVERSARADRQTSGPEGKVDAAAPTRAVAAIRAGEIRIYPILIFIRAACRIRGERIEIVLPTREGHVALPASSIRNVVLGQEWRLGSSAAAAGRSITYVVPERGVRYWIIVYLAVVRPVVVRIPTVGVRRVVDDRLTVDVYPRRTASLDALAAVVVYDVPHDQDGRRGRTNAGAWTGILSVRPVV